jgi:four helix bundle protein
MAMNNQKPSLFRFQDFEIWRRAIVLIDKLLDVAEELDKLHKYKFAEQLRSAALSITNNIAEGSGSSSKQEFKQFLNYSRRSVYEVANMLYVFHNRKYISEQQRDSFLGELEQLS